MLTRAGAVVLGAWLLTASVLSGPALADEPIVVDGDNNSGVINTTVTSPGAPAGLPTVPGGSSGDGVTCTYEQLDGMSQGLGFPGGTWYDIVCSDGTWRFRVFVPDSASNVPAPVLLARTLAERARNQLRLPVPAVGQSPVGQTLVNLPTWWWVEPSSWRGLRQRTQAGPVWAEVTATPVSTLWDPGDGSEPLVCAGPGTAYDRSRPEAGQSTDCSYIYRRSSAEQPQTGPDVNNRYFTVRVTTVWDVSWRGSGGSGGSLPRLTRTSSFPLAVAQRQTVVTGGSG
jgi:hypothetical protein